MRVLIAAAAAAVLAGSVFSRAAAGVRFEADGLRGDGGYLERSFSVDAWLPLGAPDGSPPAVSSVGAGVRRTTVESDTYEETATNDLSMSVEFIDRAGLDLTLWASPDSDDDGSSARGWTLAFSLWSAGWHPFGRESYGRVQSRWEVYAGGTGYKDRLLLPATLMRPARTADVDVYETLFGLSIGQEIGPVSLSAFGEAHGYDDDVVLASRRLEPVSPVVGGTLLDRLAGFVDRSWGAGASWDIARWLAVGGRWRRSTYETGVLPRADTMSLRVTFSPLKQFFVEPRAEWFHPLDGESTRYNGLAIGARF